MKEALNFDYLGKLIHLCIWFILNNLLIKNLLQIKLSKALSMTLELYPQIQILWQIRIYEPAYLENTFKMCGRCM
jgi:hypothetical protein